MSEVFYIASKASRQDQNNKAVQIHKCELDKDEDSAIFTEVTLVGETDSLKLQYRPTVSGSPDGFYVSGEERLIHLKINKNNVSADVMKYKMPDARYYHGMFSTKTVIACFGGRIKKEAVETVQVCFVDQLTWHEGPALRENAVSPVVTQDESEVYVLTDQLSIYSISMTMLIDFDNAATYTWTKLSITGSQLPRKLPSFHEFNTGISMSTYRHYLSGSEHGLFIVGGFLQETFMVQAKGNEYSMKTGAKPNEDHSNGALMQRDNLMYLCGGFQAKKGTAKWEKFDFRTNAWASSKISLPDAACGDPVCSFLR